MKLQALVSTNVFYQNVRVLALLTVGIAPLALRADEVPQTLPFVQDWSNPALITQENDWSGVPGFVGYRGDKLAPRPGANPQTITADGNTSPVNVLPNQKNPNTFRTGGVAEFDSLANPTVALKGSGTAGAPMLLLNLETKSKQNIAVGYKLRDLDGSVNNAVQAVALQYRVDTNAAFVDVPAAYVPDVTTGPGVATQITPIVVVLPADANDQPLLQVRWVTTNAEGNDEWVGIDDIAVIGDDIAAAPPAAAAKSAEAPVKLFRPFRSPKDASN